MRAKGASISNVHDAIITAAGTGTTKWDRLDPASGGSAIGPMLRARQTCMAVDEDEEEEEVEIEVISVVGKGDEVEVEVIDVVVEEQS